MRLRDLIQESGLIPPATEQFRRWFRGSKVVNPDGSPMIVFHGSMSPDLIGEFRSFTHFGSLMAATQRLAGIEQLPDESRSWLHIPTRANQQPSIYPVYLCIRNPITLPDTLWEDPEAIWETFVKAGLVSAEEARHLMSPETDMYPLVFLADRHNHDGIRYQNEYEDKGEISWITFHDEQVWPAYSGR